MIGSMLEQDGQRYIFLEGSTINPAGLDSMGWIYGETGHFPVMRRTS